jgi:2-methylcitrate dehydratase PrpD
VALLDGDALVAQFCADRIGAPDVWQLIERTRARHEPAFDTLPPGDRLRTTVTLRLRDGTRREATVTHPRGVGSRPLSNADVVHKFRALTGPLLDPDRQRAIEEAVLGIEDLTDLTALTELLSPAVPAAVD